MQATNRPRKPPLTVMARALNLLSRREHTRKELERKLLRPTKSGPVDRAEVTRVLDELETRGYQSDDRAARSLVLSKGSKLGARRLQMELAQKGAGQEAIAKALEEHDDLASCQRAWTKKFGRVAEDPKAKQKQLRFLIARGFGLDVIRKVLGRADELDVF